MRISYGRAVHMVSTKQANPAQKKGAVMHVKSREEIISVPCQTEKHLRCNSLKCVCKCHERMM